MPTTTNQTTEFLYPQSVNTMTDTMANYTNNLPQFANDVYQNWYNQPLTTGQTNWQTQAWGQAMANPQQQWLSPLQQASSMYQQGAQYDPSKLGQYLNPYVNDAANATMTQVNRNLTENLIPQINSTFTGAGQFGSTRNADFMNRAVRDTQQALSDTLAKQNVANYQQAQNDYQNWAKLGQSAASGLQGVAGTGSAIDQTSLTNMLTAANAQQQQQQQTLDKNYQDYLTRQQYPLNAVGALSTAAKNVGSIQQPNINVPVAQPDNVSKVLAAVQAMQAGLSDSSTQKLLNQIFGSDIFSSRT